MLILQRVQNIKCTTLMLHAHCHCLQPIQEYHEDYVHCMDFVDAYIRSELWPSEISGLFDYRSDRIGEWTVRLD